MALIGTFEKRITNRNRHNNERLVRNEKVRSSSLLGSTSLRLNAVKAKATQQG